MYPVRFNSDGTLEAVFKPAIYLDTNFIRYYYNYEGADDITNEHGEIFDKKNKHNKKSLEARTNKVFRDILKDKDYFEDFAKIRKLAIFCNSKASLLISPISLLELYKVHAEINFKEFCAYEVGAKRVQRIGVKEVGDCLSKLHEEHLKNKQDNVINNIVQSIVLNMPFARAHGLQGLFCVSNLNFQLSESDVGSFLWYLAHLQLDTVDILHLHLAKELNCDYFASLDSGFKKNADIIKESSGIEILSSTKDVIKILEQNRKD